MEKLFTVVYGFDNISELKYWKLSIKTLINSNGKNINVLTLVNDDFLLREVNEFYKESELGDSFKVIFIDDLCNFKKEGQFYWLRSPFYVDTKYILQLDNDILLNGNIQDLIRETDVNKKDKIWGVRVKIDINGKMPSTLKDIHKFNLTQKIHKKWINAGVVLVDVDWYKKTIGTKEKLINLLDNYGNLETLGDDNLIADESFLIKYFHEVMGPMPRKWNLRFQSFVTTNKFIKKGNWFFHYNLRMPVNNKHIKYNFDNLLFNENTDYLDEGTKISQFLAERYKNITGKNTKINKYNKYSEKVINEIRKIKEEISKGN